MSIVFSQEEWTTTVQIIVEGAWSMLVGARSVLVGCCTPKGRTGWAQSDGMRGWSCTEGKEELKVARWRLFETLTERWGKRSVRGRLYEASLPMWVTSQMLPIWIKMVDDLGAQKMFFYLSFTMQLVTTFRTSLHLWPADSSAQAYL